MMASPRLLGQATRAALALPLLALAACATTGRTLPAVSPRPSEEAEEATERGPGVRIWTTEEFASSSRIRASFRLDDDAYVTVINVGLDGYADVIFPESPEDDGFMRGGRTYRLPSFFPGFANHFRASSYRRLYQATSRYDGLYDRYAGYVFIIASWSPMHFRAAEALGLWDDYRLAVHERQLEPYHVMHWFAERLVPGRSKEYTARFARYAAFSRDFGSTRSFASCALAGPAMMGHNAWSAFMAMGNWWAPVYGLGYYDTGWGCGFGLTVVGYRPLRGTVVTPPVSPTRPVRPTEGAPDTTNRPPRNPRLPLGPSDSAKGEGRVKHRAAEAEESVVDVTRETRALARRRDREAERGMRDERGYRPPSGWSRRDRAGNDRAAPAGDDRTERVRHAPVDRDTRARSEPSRAEQRPSDPRRDSPPQRSEPRAEPRPQPPPRTEPAARAEPRAQPRVEPRAEPRGERPAKPTERH